ncbi:hypothetical protein ElyMa_005030100 [Elysia marginata]|uniref:Uncharacterized protein n=1 Tax=Elysia marginata TaxID=1093978 RepID=A0AAV4JAM4_9GAST|nr:hypothetical protein ElyMa_005030100 [Elysia marginata]
MMVISLSKAMISSSLTETQYDRAITVQVKECVGYSDNTEHQTHQYTELPHLEDDRAITVQMKERVGHSDIVEVGGFLVDKVEVWHPELRNQLRVKLQVIVLDKLVKFQAEVAPGLRYKQVEGKILLVVEVVVAVVVVVAAVVVVVVVVAVVVVAVVVVVVVASAAVVVVVAVVAVVVVVVIVATAAAVVAK